MVKSVDGGDNGLKWGTPRKDLSSRDSGDVIHVIGNVGDESFREEGVTVTRTGGTKINKKIN